jgi:hypothetical protein
MIPKHDTIVRTLGSLRPYIRLAVTLIAGAIAASRDQLFFPRYFSAARYEKHQDYTPEIEEKKEVLPN